MQIPWILSFWMMIAAYVVHVLDESLLGGSFVEKVRRHWWPQYTWRKFFWFNAVYFLVMLASVIAFDRLGGHLVIFPLAWIVERFCNSLWHLWWSIRFGEYSPGLVSCIFNLDRYLLRGCVSGAAAILHAGGFGDCDCNRTGLRGFFGVLHTSRQGQDDEKGNRWSR